MANNVYICQFSLGEVNDYDINASIKDSGFEYPDIKHILSRQEGRDESDETLEKKRKYHPLALELERTNRFAMQSKIVPEALWAGIEKKEIQLPTKQDYIFSIWSSGKVFNQSCANILKQHRLGENILTPVQIYDLSTGKLVSDEVFYFLNLYERRLFICQEQTTDRLKARFDSRHGVLITKSVFNDGEVNVEKSALDCDVDLWYDPRILGHFFMSESLYQSLNQAGMIDKFDPHTCKLI